MCTEKYKRWFWRVIVWGTFDRLHEGHRILLRRAYEAVFQGGRLVVCIENGDFLSAKVIPEIIEPYGLRQGNVQQFLNELDNCCGQTLNIEFAEVDKAMLQSRVEDHQLECIVVSQETEESGLKFNNRRAALGLPTVEILTVDSFTMNLNSKITKLSSSFLRLQSLGTYCRGKGARLLDGALSTNPYIVGLTGGIAAGKSYVREVLKELGAEVLDCDALGHLSYVCGTPTYNAMVSAFGTSIVGPDGSIDRQALSSVVFNNAEHMELLKRIVWVAVGQLVAEKVEAMAELGVRICFAEAALLLDAHWEEGMNEVWLVFAPLEVSCQRLMLRNKMSEEDADKRIKAQRPAADLIPLADVLIYNAWTIDETRRQVEKAWSLLQKRANSSSGMKKEGMLWPRWAALMRRLGVAENTAMKWWSIVQSSYGSSCRHHHTLSHLGSLYEHYHQYAHFIAEPNVVHLAIFFHDIVRDFSSGSHANVLNCVTTFEEFAGETCLSADIREKVKTLILHGTPGFENDDTSGDMAFFLDFSLAVVGSSPKEFLDYKTNICHEFGTVKEEQFVDHHIDLLTRFVNRKKFFHTDSFRSQFLAAAQLNLPQEMLLLGFHEGPILQCGAEGQSSLGNKFSSRL